jgi:hypothetical protein
MVKPSIEPITDAMLPEFAAFLAENMTVTRSAADWEAGLRVDWGFSRPNFGFLVRDEGKVVGGIGAYYADRIIRGQVERFCNITSWCVLESHRQQSMRLAMSVIGQPGYHFTDFSPTEVVGKSLRFLKFKSLDERQAVILNLPLPSLGSRLLSHPAEIEAALTGQALQVYKDHASFPWLKQVLVGDGKQWCHVIYKRTAFKGLPAAKLLYLSDAELFDRHFRRLSAHFLLCGMASTHVECRFLKHLPWPSAIRSGFNAKVYFSNSLADADIDYLYSESMALDL